MPVTSHGNLQHTLKLLHMEKKPRKPCSNFTYAGYAVVKPMQLPGMSPRKGNDSQPKCQPVGGRAKSQSPRSQVTHSNTSLVDLQDGGGKQNMSRSERANERVSFKDQSKVQSKVSYITADVVLPCTEDRSSFSARNNAGKAFLAARERAAEDDRLANRSVKKIEIALRHMNDQKLELADMRNQMQSLLKPQVKLERVTMQRERAKTAAQIMAPHLGAGLLPKPSKHPQAFLDESEISEDEKYLRALSKKTGIGLPDVQDYKKWFDKVDCDGSGLIERPEFETLMKDLHPSVDLRKQQVDDWWSGVDEDQSGAISFEEFILYWAAHGN